MMRTVLAGDLGGTKCRFALVDERFGVHCVQRIDTIRERGAFLDGARAAIAAVLEAGAKQSQLAAPTGFGVGAAGVVDVTGSALGDPPNLPLGGFALRDWLVEASGGLPTALINDGRASGMGEYLCGHARGHDPLLCVFFGTGIGIGLVVDGKPFAGGTNAAGEIGHTVFRPGGRRCPCGGLGHFEAYCGGRSITERAAEEIGPAADGHWTVDDVVATAAASPANGSADDPRAAAARLILADARSAASTLIANATMLLNPNAIALGGGVLKGWPALQSAVIAHVRESLDPVYHRDLKFVDSLGGSDAILWGAAAAAKADFFAQPEQG
ncbi:MAG: ROK family protein [Planctomycetota bacterium]